MSENNRDKSGSRGGGSSSNRQNSSNNGSGGATVNVVASGGENSLSRAKSDRRNNAVGSPHHHHNHQRSRENINQSGGGRGHHGINMGVGGGGPGLMGAMGPRMIFSGQAFSETELMTDLPKKKFTGRCRLFVGNLPMDLKEEELKELFAPHGDIAECYLSGKGFAFLRMDTRAHAESAKEAIDGKIIHNRPVRVRFAVHGAALKVKELSPTVSNEMLYHAFSAFGEVERAVHIVDEKGKPTGEGIVEFERKHSANEALHQIREKVFLLTASPKPLVVEMLEPRDEDDGLAERMIQRNAQLQKEREVGPRFPPTNSFEYVFGLKWKELYEMERQRRNQLEDELKEARRRLEADMELAFQDYQTQMLREDLARRQQELERLEAAKRERMAQVAARRGEMPSSMMNNNLPGQGGPPQVGLGGPNAPSSGPQRHFGGPNGPDISRGPPNQGDMMGRGPPDNMMRNGPPMDGPMGRNIPPPFQQGPNQGPRPGGPVGSGTPGGQSGPGMGVPDPTLVQGVQKLLQIFRTDNPGGGRSMPQGPQGFGPNFMGPGGPPFGPGGPAGPFHRGPPINDFAPPSEKRMRR